MTGTARGGIALALWAAMGAAGPASAGPITYTFAAEDGAGRTARARLTFDPAVGASLVTPDEDGEGAAAEHTAHANRPMRFEAGLVGGARLVADVPRDSPGAFMELVVYDAWSPLGGADGLTLVLLADDFSATLRLHSSDPGAIPDVRYPPASLDLGTFDLRRQLAFGDFDGTITSISAVPEPGSLATAACGIAGAIGLAAARRRRAA